jgi:hypothetical protein
MENSLELLHNKTYTELHGWTTRKTALSVQKVDKWSSLWFIFIIYSLQMLRTEGCYAGYYLCCYNPPSILFYSFAKHDWLSSTKAIVMFALNFPVAVKQLFQKNKKQKTKVISLGFFFQLTHEKNVYREFHHHDIWYIDKFTLCVWTAEYYKYHRIK